VRRGAQVLLRDLASKNGTRLDEKRIEPNRETPWPPGSKVELANTSLALEDPLLAALAELESGADEPMAPDESVEPPPGSASEEPIAQRAGGGPLADVPERKLTPEPRRQRGLRLADVLIAGLALVVLALSLLGLLWVLRSN
jgi:pSer/pThr/pTyr-binding forkhead associated (FHA) protein